MLMIFVRTIRHQLLMPARVKISGKNGIFTENLSRLYSMQSIERRILSRIFGHGKGWAFTKVDFVADFGEDNVHKALSSLAHAGRIRRVCRSVYDYPRYGELSGDELSPDIDQVAHALARKFNWRIQASGEVALNLLGLSTQVPGRWSYLSDGPSREYDIGARTVAFRKSALKDAGFKLRESGLLVQALKALGRERIDAAVIEVLHRWLDLTLRERVLADARTATGWIYDIIRQVCAKGVG